MCNTLVVPILLSSRFLFLCCNPRPREKVPRHLPVNKGVYSRLGMGEVNRRRTGERGRRWAEAAAPHDIQARRRRMDGVPNDGGGGRAAGGESGEGWFTTRQQRRRCVRDATLFGAVFHGLA